MLPDICVVLLFDVLFRVVVAATVDIYVVNVVVVAADVALNIVVNVNILLFEFRGRKKSMFSYPH